MNKEIASLFSQSFWFFLLIFILYVLAIFIKSLSNGYPIIRVIQDAEIFYDIHKERPFFNSLVEYMTSGPVQVQVLEGENAVSKYREIMGATNPAEAENGTIRNLYAESIEANSVHGSDSEENAKIEIQFFFSGSELA